MQKSIDSAIAPVITELTQEYTIDNCPLFPGKAIYTNNNRYWEVTDTKKRVWAAAIVGVHMNLFENYRAHIILS